MWLKEINDVFGLVSLSCGKFVLEGMLMIKALKEDNTKPNVLKMTHYYDMSKTTHVE